METVANMNERIGSYVKSGQMSNAVIYKPRFGNEEGYHVEEYEGRCNSTYLVIDLWEQ